MLTQPIKWYGGKHYLAKRIVALMPPHVHYVEPYAGGLSVLLAKDPVGVSETVNDIHVGLTNFWRVLQNESSFALFQRQVEAMPFSQPEWNAARRYSPKKNRDVEAAVAFFVRCRQSWAGKGKEFAALSKSRTRRGMNEQVSAWLTAVEGLPAIALRIKRVAILCDDAIDVIRRHDSPMTLFYLDPTYLHETRVSTEDFEHEMTRKQHVKMLNAILRCKGKVMLSGYPNGLYEKKLREWRRADFKIDNKASAAKVKPIKTERLWMNY